MQLKALGEGLASIGHRATISAHLGLTNDDGTGVPAPVPPVESSPIPTGSRQ